MSQYSRPSFTILRHYSPVQSILRIKCRKSPIILSQFCDFQDLLYQLLASNVANHLSFSHCFATFRTHFVNSSHQMSQHSTILPGAARRGGRGQHTGPSAALPSAFFPNKKLPSQRLLNSLQDGSCYAKVAAGQARCFIVSGRRAAVPGCCLSSLFRAVV